MIHKFPLAAGLVGLTLSLAALATPMSTVQAADAPSSILNVSYDVARELFAQLNPVFVKQWQDKTKQTIEIKQSHGGSSSQARSVLEGLQADVVTFNQVTDVQVLHDKGQLIPADWQKRFANNSSPFYSLPAFLVRKGNPKKIKDWDDLVRDGVQVVFPNPKTSGNGRYTYLAAFAYALEKSGGDKAKAQAFAKKLLANVPVFDTGGRAATTTFVEREIGDVLVTFEAEAFGTRREIGGDKFEVVVPSISLLAEFPVALVDKVADARSSRAVATAYLQFLYSAPAQEVIAQNFYRAVDPAVAKAHAAQFPAVKLVPPDDLGGWEKITAEHFAAGGLLDQIFVAK